MLSIIRRLESGRRARDRANKELLIANRLQYKRAQEIAQGLFFIFDFGFAIW
jgi:hypothetical protein